MVKTYFDQPSYKHEREGCASHPNSGAWETELPVNSPDFLLVVVNLINTVMSEDGLRYTTRKEECEVYEPLAVIQWDGVASPTSGRTQGHYTAYLKYGRSLFHMNNNVIKKLPSSLSS